MSKFFQRVLVCGAMILLPTAIFAQQLTNANFEDWSAAQFDGNPQPAGWNASNVTQFNFKFNFAHKESGHNGGYCMMVQDQDVGAAGITETSPGYFSLGTPWVYVPSLTQVSSASAGDYGGISWAHRPDSMTVWIKRTGNNTSKEDFYLLYYAWKGTAQGTKYKAKNGSCTGYSVTDEESDIRQELDGNECGTAQVATQICEGMWREKKTYANWTKITVPIYYFNNEVPQKMNIIFSASNYPNFRANSGLYAGNSLYVDDVELIYSSKIQQLFINDKEWKGFDPNNEGIQYYALGETATQIPTIEARRGAGSLTNARGKTVPFNGRVLSGSEITVTPGDLENQPTLITVHAEDGSSTTTYKIQFQRAKSKNANLASISYALGSEVTAVPGFVPGKYSYNVELPYGTAQVPVVSYVKQEDEQTVTITQPTSVNGTATIQVTAADVSVKKTYTLNFSVGLLKDVTLQDIKVNGKSITGFAPSQAVYKVSLPTNTTAAPTVQPISAYPAGEQTITVNVPTLAQIQAGGAQAQAQITVSAPGATTSKTYKLNFKIEESTYSYLSSLTLESDRIESVNPSVEGDVTSLAFEPDLTTYYINLQMGTKYLPQILYQRGDEFQTVTIDSTRFSNGNGTVSINVMAGNQMDQTIYKLVFYAPKSENTNLGGVLINDVEMADFDPAVTNYTDTLKIGESYPTIKPIKGDEYQTITVSTRKSGSAQTTTITVMAGNGDSKSYNFTYYSQTYTDNRLENLEVEGFSLLNRDGNPVSFDAEVKEYWVNLPMGTAEIPTITATLRNAQYQDTTETMPTDLNGVYKVFVKPISGAGRTYTIHFSVAVSKNAALAMIFLDGEPLEGFNPDVRDYVHTVEKGESVPAITWTAGDAVQTVDTVTKKNTKYLTVTAGDKKTKRVYSIRFKFPASDNTQLLDIKLKYADRKDTISMKYSHKFRGDSVEYSIELDGATCPQIFPVAAAGQKVAVAAPYADGTATIKVISEDGLEETTYTIEFTKAIVEAVQLTRITYTDNGNNKTVPGFDSKKTHYEMDWMSEELPVIGYEPVDANAKVYWKNREDSLIAYIRVTDGDNEGVYDIVFNRIISSNDSLIGIYANGVLIDGFTPDTTSYTFDLAAGQAYPALSYQVAEKAQVVFFGQLAEGLWGLTVRSAEGTTKEYTVQYNHAKFDNAYLENLQVAGDLITDFDSLQFSYGPFKLGNGEPMPQVTATPKADKNQKVLIYAPNDHEQNVLVIAENAKDSITYKITYTRVLSANCKLAALYIDGKPLATFHPDTLHYTIPLTSADTVVKNVYPVGQLDNQVITTTFGKPGETTTIVVDAQDGNHSQTYTIDFPIELNSNTKLGSLTINGDEMDVNETEYEFTLKFGENTPYSVEFTRADSTQMIQFIDAPVTGVTKIIVTAENKKDTRTYSIRYKIAEPEPKENKLLSISYSYRDASNVEHTETIANPQKGENIVDLPFGATDFAITNIEKNYTEQSIVSFKGGIRRGAKITVVANRTGVADATYIVTPRMPEFDTTGKLQSLKYKVGDEFVDVPNFRPDVYNYMINVTAQPTADDIQAVAYGGAAVTFSPFDETKKQVILTVPGGESYSICWFYMNDKDPLDFSGSWVQTTNNVQFYIRDELAVWPFAEKDTYTTIPSTGYKPSNAWTVPADVHGGMKWSLANGVIPMIYYTGKEVVSAGANGVMLSTLRGSSLEGSVPGMMTLGDMSITFKKSGKSTSSITETKDNAYPFRNTPDSMAFHYKPLSCMNITGWSAYIMTTDGTNLSTKSNYSGSYSTLNVRGYASVPVKYNNLTKPVSGLHITLNSAHTTDAGDIAGGDIHTADLQLENVHLVYNSKLTKAIVKVNGSSNELEPVGNVFTYNVPDGTEVLGLPALKFEGAVHDQTQVVEWLNDGEWINGNLTARVINYGENSADSTHYYVVLHRDPDEETGYDVQFEGVSYQNALGDTTFVVLPFAHTKFPEFTITPNNDHQRFAVNKEGNNIMVIVTNEKNVSDTMTYVFREEPSSDVTLDEIEATGLTPTFAAATLDYTIDGVKMPEVSFSLKGEKASKALHQTVDLKYFADSATVKVTAEDGTTTQTYVIRLNKPVVASNHQIAKFYNAGEELTPWATLGGTTYFEQAAKPDTAVLFERCFAADAVTFIQTPDSMEWRVAGNSESYVRKYPTDSSANNLLKTILVAGVPLEGFEPTNSGVTYPVPAETTEILEAVAAEDVQTIETTMKEITGGVEYEITVKAQNKSTRTYRVQMTRPLSPDSTLAGILLDSVMITGFDPNINDYNITLPIAKGPKKAHVKMPNITYVAANNGQTIDVNAGELNVSPTTITVAAEDGGGSMVYNVMINEELSSCTELTGITINGKSVDPNFEPGRHFYSTTVDKDLITIDYTSEDRFFQKVDTIIKAVKPGIEYHYTLRVTAEDGTQADYLVEIYVQNQSNDTQLANILLDNMDFVTYKATAELANPQLKAFDPGKNDYIVKAPIDKIPSVSGQLKMDGQKVTTTVESTDQVYCVHLNVLAVDGVTSNEYKVYIERTLPQLNRLTSISIDGDTIKPFDPNKHSYIYDKLADGAALPEVEEIGYTTEDEAIQNDSKFVQITRSEADKLITITVHAQDTAYPTAEYNISFIFRKDTVNTLETINETREGVTNAVNGWDPKGSYFHTDLPIGEEYPEISYGDDRYPGDGKWPRIDSMTVALDTINLTWQHQTIVTAQDGSSHTYTVSYRKLRSNVTTLNMLKVSLNGQDFYAVEGFNPEVTEYNYTLKPDDATALGGRMPVLDWTPGDIYQTIDTITALDSLSTKSLGYKHIITVTAATGRTRNYTVHYPVELSTDATLRTIKYNNGGAIPNFDGERENYKIEIEKNAEIPNLIPVKNVEGQRYEQDSLAGVDTIRYFVWAEDRNYTKTYTIAFERMLSTWIKLDRITLTDTLNNKPISHDLFDFKPDQFDYTIILPYDSLNRDILPLIEYIEGDPAQTVWAEETKLKANQTMVTVHVVAENDEYSTEYNLTFQFTRNNDTKLKDIKIHGEELADFSPLKIDYEYQHPYGSDSASFFKAEDVEVLLSDIAATYQVSVDEDGAISIVVTAQDGVSQTTYTIIQTIGLDGDNFLEAILLHVAAEDGTVTVDTLRGFDPEITFYTYLLPRTANATPTVEALARSVNADVSVKTAIAGDTCLIICTAQDLKERRYYVYFKYSDLDETKDPTGNDVIAKCLSNTELFVGTIRKDVYFALFDEQGHRLYYANVPTADPNDAVIVTDLDNKEILTDVINSRSGLVINITPGKIYFYTFIYGDKTIMQRLAGNKAKKLKSGKLITRP